MNSMNLNNSECQHQMDSEGGIQNISLQQNSSTMFNYNQNQHFQFEQEKAEKILTRSQKKIQEIFNITKQQFSQKAINSSNLTLKQTQKKPKQDSKRRPNSFQDEEFIDDDDEKTYLRRHTCISKGDYKKKYKQSVHKNIYKNFGLAIKNFITEKDEVKKLINDKFSDIQQAIFLKWLNDFVQLKRKDDYIRGWLHKKNDDTVKMRLKELLRQISSLFFDKYAEKYIKENSKLKKQEIHLKTIPIFQQGIKDPYTLSECIHFSNC